MYTERCPACDWKSKVHKNEVNDDTYFFVKCSDCGLSQKRNKYKTEKDAVMAWNCSCIAMREY